MGEVRAIGWALFVPVVIGVVLAALHPIDDPEVYAHVAEGRRIAALGHVPHFDASGLQDAAPRAWLNQTWLADLSSYGAFELAGSNGLLGLELLLLIGCAGLVLLRALQQGGQLSAIVTALVLVWALPPARFAFSMRPERFGLLLGALCIWALPRVAAVVSQATTVPAQQAPSGGPQVGGGLPSGGGASNDNGPPAGGAWACVALLAVAQLAWVNLDASHLLGPALTLAYLLVLLPMRTAAVRLAVLLGLQLLASCVTPFGPGLLLAAVEQCFDPAFRALSPAWSLPYAEPPVVVGVGMGLQVLGLTLALPGLRAAGRPALAGLAASVLLVSLALWSRRFAPELVLLTAPVIGEGLGRRIASASRDYLRMGLVGAAGLTSLCVPTLAASAPPYRSFGTGGDAPGMPAACAQWLQAHQPRPRLLADLPDASYLRFGVRDARLLADRRVALHGVAGVAAVQAAFSHRADFEALLARSAVDAVVVRPFGQAHGPALAALRARRDFSLVMISARHALYVRGNHPLALRALKPSYDVGPVWGTSVDPQRVRAELARLGDHPQVAGFRAWTEALLSLRPFARHGGRAGLRPPRDAAEGALMADAAARMRAAVAEVGAVASAMVWPAAPAIAACELKLGEQLLNAAAPVGMSRELLMLRNEVLLRRGEGAKVQRFIKRAREVPGTANDPWLRALGAAAAKPPICP